MAGKLWTKKEDEILVTARSQGKNEIDIQKLVPHRTVKAIGIRLSRLNLTCSIEWTDDENKKLIEFLDEGLTPKQIFKKWEISNRTYIAIKHHCKLFKSWRKIDNWRASEVLFLVEARNEGKPYKEIIKDLPNRDEISCIKKMHRMGKSRKLRRFSDSEDEIIINEAKLGKKPQQISKYLIDRSNLDISQRMALLGIRKPKEIEDLPKGFARCRGKCGRVMTILEFYIKPNGKTYSYCHSCSKIAQQEWIENNIDHVLQYRTNVTKPRALLKQKEERKLIKKEAAARINKFYQDNEIPKKEWLEKEFSNELDLQRAVSHVLANRFGLWIEEWVDLEAFGYPDLYIPELNLFLEIKLTSKYWTKKKILEQVNKYKNLEDTWIICLDSAPDWLDVLEWYTPEELFKIVGEIISL